MHKVNHGWLHHNVRPYFERKGIRLLRDDMMFIEECLEKIPTERHKSVMRDYFTIWNTTVEKNNIIQSETFNARFEANVFLRMSAKDL